MNRIILQALQDFSLDQYLPIVRRELDLGEALEPRAGNLVKVVVGMRRSGKSYRLFQEMQSLIAAGVGEDRICYFNFEDDRLAPVTGRTGDEVLETFFYLHPDSVAQGLYLFLDELQEMEGWGAWLRRVVDTRKATIYVTGSSSKMLSTEMATEFRGRAISFELLPYSLREVASTQAPELLEPGRTFSTESVARARRLLDSYLAKGGFPGAQALPDQQRTMLLQSYARRVVARDVVERHNLDRPRVATVFAQRLLGTNAMPFSLRKVESDMRSAGIATSRAFLADLLAYLEDAYLAFAVHEFSYSLAEATTSMPKVYAVDPGLALANGRANTNELGQRLEDSVYLELRRRTVGQRRDGICPYRTRTHRYEVDFIVGEAVFGEGYGLYQVASDVSDEKTLARETRALWEAMEETGLDRSWLIVGDGPRRTYEQDGRAVEQVPAWQWLLGVG